MSWKLRLALLQAWPTLVAGHLGHLWEAGLDPLDPLFLANIKDPAVHLVRSASESRAASMTGLYRDMLLSEIPKLNISLLYGHLLITAHHSSHL